MQLTGPPLGPRTRAWQGQHPLVARRDENFGQFWGNVNHPRGPRVPIRAPWSGNTPAPWEGGGIKPSVDPTGPNMLTRPRGEVPEGGLVGPRPIAGRPARGPEHRGWAHGRAKAMAPWGGTSGPNPSGGSLPRRLGLGSHPSLDKQQALATRVPGGVGPMSESLPDSHRWGGTPGQPSGRRRTAVRPLGTGPCSRAGKRISLTSGSVRTVSPGRLTRIVAGPSWGPAPGEKKPT